MRVCDLRQKDVINVSNCKSLGSPVDIEFDPKTGQVCSIVIPGPGRLYNLLGREGDYVIPWCCIKQIGEDIILVEINEERCFQRN